jgi:hypothetical protein
LYSEVCPHFPVWDIKSSRWRLSGLLLDSSFSQRWLWRVASSGLYRRGVRWKSTDKHETSMKQGSPCSPLHAGFLLALLFWHRRWRWYIHPKRPLTFAGLDGVISQKIELFRDLTCNYEDYYFLGCDAP